MTTNNDQSSTLIQLHSKLRRRLIPSLMTGFLLQIAAVERLSLSFTKEYHHRAQTNHRAFLARATAAAARLRRRRAHRTPSASPLQKRRAVHGSQFLHRLLTKHIDMTSYQEIRRRSSATDRVITDSFAAGELNRRATAAMFATPSNPPARPPREQRQYDCATSLAASPDEQIAADPEALSMPPPPRPISQDFDAPPLRRTRSTSVASRNANRLSLTLPIAPPTSDPSRPKPTSAISSSFPPTPVETPSSSTSSHANEFIIAIATQERRILELREELGRAEAELGSLKKQWSSADAYQRRKNHRAGEATRSLLESPDRDSTSSLSTADLDRKKLLFQSQVSTPTQTRRRVLRGGHTRTLSLLSPPKSKTTFDVLDDEEKDKVRLPPLDQRPTPLLTPDLSKRASWQPRTSFSHSPVPGLVEDFKLGLRAFVEDIRQITVGDEPIKGRNTITSGPLRQPNISGRASPDDSSVDQAQSLRSNAGVSTPTPGTKSRDAGRPARRTGKNKSFSWTPLGIDSVGDSDWSNWESPASAKSVRWSGSTVSNGEKESAHQDREAGSNSSPR